MTPEDREALKSAQWITASGSNGDCLYAAKLATGNIAIRESDNPDADPIITKPGSWAAFAKGVRDGAFPF